MRPVKVLTMILAGGVGERLYPLTAQRSKPAVPFGGNFRIIDFTLMNCVLSGLRDIHLLTQYHSLSLGEHKSRRWNFLSAELGEGIEIVPPKMRTSTGYYQGTADAIYRNLDLLERHRPDIVLVLSGDHVYRADYSRFIDAHLESDADITVLTGAVPEEEASSFGVVQLGKKGNIESFVEKPKDPSPYVIDGNCLINLGVYCFDTDFLVKRLAEDSKKKSAHDFGKNILPTSLELGSVVSCTMDVICPDDRPYWRDVGTIDSYFQANMDLLDGPAPFRLRDGRWATGSRFHEWLPARQTVHAEIDGETVIGANLLSSATSIEDATIVRSILSQGVRVGAGSELVETILMPDVEIEGDCRLRRVIVEEGARIPRGTHIGVDESSCQHTRSADGVVVVSSNYRFDAPVVEVTTEPSPPAPEIDADKDGKTKKKKKKASRKGKGRKRLVPQTN